MARLFLVRRSQAAREQAHRDVDASVEAIATLVALVTALADRMDEMASAGGERDRERRARVQLLRSTAAAGRRTLTARARSRTESQDGQRHARG